MEHPEVPERTVSHDFDDDESLDTFALGKGDISTLEMGTQAKAAARRKREKLDRELGGFGFRSAA